MLLDDEDDPGAHTVHPETEGHRGDYVLASGQCREWAV
jgi:hypothetical protein